MSNIYKLALDPAFAFPELQPGDCLVVTELQRSGHGHAPYVMLETHSAYPGGLPAGPYNDAYAGAPEDLARALELQQSRPYFKQSTGITREQSDALVASLQPRQEPVLWDEAIHGPAPKAVSETFFLGRRYGMSSDAITAEHYAKLPDVAAYIAVHGSPLDVPPGERAALERHMDEAMARHAADYQRKCEAHDRALHAAPVPTMVVNRNDYDFTLMQPLALAEDRTPETLRSDGDLPAAEEPESCGPEDFGGDEYRADW